MCSGRHCVSNAWAKSWSSEKLRPIETMKPYFDSYAVRLKQWKDWGGAEGAQRAYQLALCRMPSRQESSLMLEFLASETARQGEDNENLEPGEARQLALRQMCRVILNLNELAYTD